jgi:hypothetical protein
MHFDIESLSASADWWEAAGYIASAIVVIGILVESIELFRFVLLGKIRERMIEVVGLLLVVLGLAGEILTQVQSNNRTGLIIGLLNKQAKEASGQIAEANARALEAQLALEKFKSPRTISKWDLWNISSAMRVFKDIRFDASVRGGDIEAGSLLVQIESTLSDAGWKQLDWQGENIIVRRWDRPIVGANAGIGVGISVKPDEQEMLFGIAKSLSESLVAAGIESQADINGNIASTNQNAIHIFVGEKPR